MQMIDWYAHVHLTNPKFVHRRKALWIGLLPVASLETCAGENMTENRNHHKL